jgi:hypothetical protein
MNEIFKTTRLKFQEMYEDANVFIEKTYGNVGRYFTSASPFGQILRVTINVARLIFYYIEDSITELNINTATRPDSIRGLSRLVGHNPTRPISASGTIRLTYNGKNPDIYGSALLIPNFTVLKNEDNSLKYTIFLDGESTSLELTGRNSVLVGVKQGEIQVQKFTSDGEKMQSFNAAVRGAKYIDHHQVIVYVNNESWKVYDSLYDIPYEGKGCLVKTASNTGIDIFFGNGNFGAVPQNGSEIRIEYLLTQGFQGNINTTDTKINWKFLEDGFDIQGAAVDINEYVNVSIDKAITFGTNFEPLYLTRIIAPKQSRAFVLANPSNYIIFLEKFNYFGIIDAYTTFGDEYLDDDNVIYLFLVPDVNKRITGSDNYFTIPQDYFILTASDKDKIYDLIEGSGQKMVTAVNTIVDPIIKKYVLNVALVIFEGNSKDYIKQQIIEKMSQYFATFRRRDRIPKSDLIRIIEGVDGVDSVNLWFTSQDNEAIKKNDPTAADIGIDEFGDILIGRGELPLIRGGWTDRNDIFYEDSTSDQKPSSVNISVKKIVQKTYNAERHRINVNNITG